MLRLIEDYKEPRKSFRTYMRVCRRCESIFKSDGKYGKFCDTCKKGTGGRNGIKKV